MIPHPESLSKKFNSLWGSHLSIAGGHTNALIRASEIGIRTVALFTASPRIWKRSELSPESIDTFRNKRVQSGILHVFAHALYLANPASSKPDIRKKTISALVQELIICHSLQIPWLVLHPGSHHGTGEVKGIREVAAALDQAIEESGNTTTGFALETTSGSGYNLGGSFEHLRDIIAASRFPDRYAVCFDTCHSFAAGYDFRSQETWEQTKTKLDETVGINNVKLLHLNDSKGDLGSNKDRHAHIGQGNIGDAGFCNILNDHEFKHIPGILETPKNNDHSLDWMNLEKLKDLTNR